MTFSYASPSKSQIIVPIPAPVYQCTLRKDVSLHGKTLFSGSEASVTLKPAPEGHGIIFKRVDLDHKPEIPAHVDFVIKTPRCTILEKNGVTIQCVEHLLSALSAYGIDNAIIELEGNEIPIGDGSALPFVQLIEQSGYEQQDQKKDIYELKEPVYWEQGEVFLAAVPSSTFRITYTLSYPHSPRLKAQFFSNEITSEIYKREIAPSRTFSLYEEVAMLLERGVIKGTLENGVVIKGDEIVNPEGLRFPDEMVRHKVLDLIGDLFLVSVPFNAHIVAVKSGHTSNTALARELVRHLMRE